MKLGKIYTKFLDLTAFQVHSYNFVKSQSEIEILFLTYLKSRDFKL